MRELPFLLEKVFGFSQWPFGDGYTAHARFSPVESNVHDIQVGLSIALSRK